MTMAKIAGYRLVSFKSKDAEKKGFTELMGISSEIHSVSDKQYIISSAECDYLSDRGIDYHVEKKF